MLCVVATSGVAFSEIWGELFLKMDVHFVISIVHSLSALLLLLFTVLNLLNHGQGLFGNESRDFLAFINKSNTLTYNGIVFLRTGSALHTFCSCHPIWTELFRTCRIIG